MLTFRQWLRQRFCAHNSTTGVSDDEFAVAECNNCGLVTLHWTRSHAEVLADYERTYGEG